MKTPLIKKSEKVYAITYEDDYERRGEPAEIVGLKKVSHIPTIPQTNNHIVSNLYFVIKFEDGEQDFILKDDMLDNGKWIIATLQDILRVGMPSNY
jgi:hypothetical protein